MLGQAARVNTVAVFVAIMFWGWLWGSLGLVIAVPILMIVKTVADRIESLSTVSELLGQTLDLQGYGATSGHLARRRSVHRETADGRHLHTYQARTTYVALAGRQRRQ